MKSYDELKAVFLQDEIDKLGDFDTFEKSNQILIRQTLSGSINTGKIKCLKTHIPINQKKII